MPFEMVLFLLISFLPNVLIPLRVGALKHRSPVVHSPALNFQWLLETTVLSHHGLFLCVLAGPALASTAAAVQTCPSYPACQARHTCALLSHLAAPSSCFLSLPFALSTPMRPRPSLLAPHVLRPKEESFGCQSQPNSPFSCPRKHCHQLASGVLMHTKSRLENFQARLKEESKARPHTHF